MSSTMPYHVYMQCNYLRITPEQHKRIREIVGFKKIDCVGPFSPEPIDLYQVVEITEYLIGDVNNDWIMKTFNLHKFETKPLISLSMFMMCIICEFRIGAEIPGKVPGRCTL